MLILGKLENIDTCNLEPKREPISTPGNIHCFRTFARYMCVHVHMCVCVVFKKVVE